MVWLRYAFVLVRQTLFLCLIVTCANSQHAFLSRKESAKEANSENSIFVREEDARV